MKELRILGRDESIHLIVKHCIDLAGLYELEVRIIEEPEWPSAIPPWVHPASSTAETAVPKEKPPKKKKVYSYTYTGGKTVHPDHHNMQKALVWLKAQDDKRKFTANELAQESGVHMRGGHKVVMIRSLETQGWIAFVDRGGPVGAKRYWKGDKLRDFGQAQPTDDPQSVS